MDLNMPIMDGMQTIVQMRQLEAEGRLDRIVTFILTSYLTE